jgi:hypothetical protein
MLKLDWTGTCEQLWTSSGRPCIADLSARPGPPEQIVELSQFRSYRRPQAMLAMQMIDGLLAVHQAGSYIAILHPYRSVKGAGAGDERPLFEREEKAACPSNCRPFPPQKMTDHRHILFSTPFALYAVNVWSLRDWAYRHEKDRYHMLVDSSDDHSPKLACRPLPLDESRLGVISRRGNGQYLWTVLNLPELVQTGGVCNLAEDSVPLSVTGSACHMESVPDRAVAIATSDGHWAWRRADALEGKVDQLRRTWPRDPGAGTLVGNAHEEAGHEFYSLRHFLLYERGQGRSPQAWSPPRHFTWFYKRRGHRVNPLECYRVDCETLEPEYPIALDPEVGTVPLGPYVHGEGPNAPHRFLFCSGRQLSYDAGGDLRAVPGHGQIEDIEQCPGAIFCDPVLIVIGQGQAATERALSIRSLHHPNQQMAVTLPAIQADPLIWSRWLFTVEVGENYSLMLNRRDLQPAGATK